MKLIKKRGQIKEWLTCKFQGLVYKLDNTGNGNLTTNGEVNFIRSLGSIYVNRDFTFFDIGANKGDYTKIIIDNFSKSKKNIHVFEPQKSCVTLLEKDFASQRNITINNFGLSDVSIETTLYKDFDRSGLASVYNRNLDYYNIDVSKTESVRLEKTIDYIARKKIAKIDLVKIDVEGHELNVLRGFENFISPKKIDFIQFEYGGANLDSHTSLLELFNFLESKGYIICKIMPKYLEIKKYNPRLENFMYANYVALNPIYIK